MAGAGDCRDESCLRKVDSMNPDYILREKGAILNWFDIEAPEGYFSLNDKLSDITATVQGKLLFAGLAAKVIKNLSGKSKDGKAKAGGFEMSEGMMQMMGGFTVIRLTSLMGAADIHFTKEELLDLNAKLNKIKKPKKK